jgi:trimeric autotransporter adhesin
MQTITEDAMKKYSFLFLLWGSTLLNAQTYTITTIAGNGTWGYNGDGGPATAAELNSPWGVTVDMVGNTYIADRGNNCIRKINTSGIISTIAGNGTSGYSGDGGAATAAELGPTWAVAVDISGNLYIADYNNNRIRKVNSSGIISTFAGGGFGGDGGPATSAQLNNPSGIAIDKNGNIYIADLSDYRIRKVNNSGIISTVAGNGTQSYSGDGGPATSAELFWPEGVALDTSGNIYISDYGIYRVRKVNAAGTITTIAGNGTPGYTGDGGTATAAEVNALGYVCTDNTGNVYIADYGSERIRKVNPSGVINSIAGDGYSNGGGGYSGDGGPALLAELNEPQGVAADDAGNIYVADYYNARIRKLTSGASGVSEIPNQLYQLTLFPNPSIGKFTIVIAGEAKQSSGTMEIYNVLGEKIYDATLKQVQGDNSIDISNQPNGIYLYRVISESGSLIGEGKIVVQK